MIEQNPTARSSLVCFERVSKSCVEFRNPLRTLGRLICPSALIHSPNNSKPSFNAPSLKGLKHLFPRLQICHFLCMFPNCAGHRPVDRDPFSDAVRDISAGLAMLGRRTGRNSQNNRLYLYGRLVFNSVRWLSINVSFLSYFDSG